MDVREFLSQFEYYDQNLEFFYGVAVAVFIVILIPIISWLFFTPKCQGIKLPGENGTFFVSAHAIEDFITRILAEQEEMLIERVRLSKRGREFAVDVIIKVSGDTNVQELRPLIEERILTQVRTRIGIENPNTVDITLKNFSAKDSQINRRHKLAMKEFKKQEEAS